MMGNEAFVNEPDSPRPLRVFLCHASSDKPTVRQLYQRLCAEGIDAWLDEEKLLPGHDWQREIRTAVRASDVVIACLSRNSVSKFGFVQKEIKFALDVADEQPEGTIYLIPLKLQECNVPDRLSRWQWVNFYEEKSWEKLMRALRTRSRDLGIGVALKEVTRISGREVKVDKAEAERLEREAREKAARDEAERQAKLAEKLEAERQAKEKAERQAKLAAENAQAERLQQERREREARAKAAKEAERKARERVVRERINAAWGRLRHIPPLVWAGPLVLLLLVGVVAVWFGVNYGKPPLVPTATALAVVTKPSLTPLGVAAQTFIATSTFTPTQPSSSILTATPTPTPTGTPTPTPVTPTMTRTPSWTPIPSKSPVASLTPVPSAVQPELVAPRDGSGPYRNPILFRWRGSLSAGQAYQVTVITQGGGVRELIAGQSGFLETESWKTDLPGTGWASTGPLHWTVLVVSGGNVVAVSPEWGFFFDPAGGAPQPPTE